MCRDHRFCNVMEDGKGGPYRLPCQGLLSCELLLIPAVMIFFNKKLSLKKRMAWSRHYYRVRPNSVFLRGPPLVE